MFEDFRQTLESMHLQSMRLPSFQLEQMATSSGAIHIVKFEKTPQNVKIAKQALHYSGIKL